MFGFLFLPFRIATKVAYTGALVALPFAVIEAKTGLRYVSLLDVSSTRCPEAWDEDEEPEERMLDIG